MTDHGLAEHDAEVVIAAAAMFHDTGMAIHRTDHEAYSLFLTADKLGGLLAPVYEEPERTVIVAEAMHADHLATARAARRSRSRARSCASPTRSTWPRAARGSRSRPASTNIHALSNYAIDEVRISAGEDKAVRVEVAMNNSAGIYQVDEGLGTKLRGTPLEQHFEVVARIEGEHERRLLEVFRL